MFGLLPSGHFGPRQLEDASYRLDRGHRRCRHVLLLDHLRGQLPVARR